jgi:hypothetical protein
MALKQIYANNAATYLSQPLGGTTGDDTLFIIETDMYKFPEPVLGSEFFVGTLENVQTKEWEIVQVTRRINNQMSIIRGQENSSIREFPIGTKFQIRVTKETLERLYDQASAISGFIHEQQTASNTWLINHNLNRIPNTAIEIGEWNAGEFIKRANAEADITHISLNALSISFSENTMGRVICT